MAEPTPTLAERCRQIRLLVVDVDGVLTPGDIIHGGGGPGAIELKRFHVRDGSGLVLWQRAGKVSAVITGRESLAVELRARELGIPVVMQGVADKGEAFRRLLADTGARAEEACFVGDDLPDLPCLREAGLAVAVADACPEARATAHYVTAAPGGHGAVRETVERVLRCQGLWK
jgi:3-deoxy-D-manno-octulosonate 8-phosphate phosphatase (KDO 8-P phosphatase)